MSQDGKTKTNGSSRGGDSPNTYTRERGREREIEREEERERRERGRERGREREGG